MQEKRKQEDELRRRAIPVGYVPSGLAITYAVLIAALLGTILGLVIVLVVRQQAAAAAPAPTTTTTTTTTTVAPTTTPATPNVVCGGDIQAAVNAFTEVILTSPCIYNVTTSIFLRSGSILRASPPDRLAVLQLANEANQAVILIGNTLEVGNSAPLMTNVVVRDIAIDGNKAQQSSEFTPGMTWLRNNGIDVRYVSGLVIENVYIHDARSGAIVVSWDSTNIRVSNSLLQTNFFDGIALYTSTDILVSNCDLSLNTAAGISIDNNLRNTRFQNCLVHHNSDVGIFQRWTTNVSYDGCQVYSNANHGAFLSWNSPTTGTGVINTTFTNCQITNNVGRAINLDSPAPESTGTLVASTTIYGNTATPFSGPNGGSLPQCSQIVVFDGGGNPPTITTSSITCV